MLFQLAYIHTDVHLATFRSSVTFRRANPLLLRLIPLDEGKGDGLEGTNTSQNVVQSVAGMQTWVEFNVNC